MRTSEAGRWTAEREDRLRALWADGYSASVIARMLGPDLTKNAIIGKVGRLKLPSRATHVSNTRPREFKLVSKPPVEVRPDTWTALPGTTPVSMAELEQGMCKWPIGESPFLFCGAEAQGVYCEHHKALSIGPGTVSERQALDGLKAAA